ncbi:hypothetical protein [Kitasatospora sp. SUK 42]|uniref:hypothetical protein n=1 Tax=Kitasatospora sp. SUK 42 TaxID=1588882 RepID=UPI0018CAFBA6|nr:hypothetical protein [Kitasatospora sp. SUK 42]MBV2154672.1 hypothetical protein [Kitasatospora sp. SUK 42]
MTDTPDTRLADFEQHRRLVTVDGAVASVPVLDFVEGPDGGPLVSAVRAVRNPHKLAHLAGPA